MKYFMVLDDGQSGVGEVRPYDPGYVHRSHCRRVLKQYSEGVSQERQDEVSLVLSRYAEAMAKQKEALVALANVIIPEMDEATAAVEEAFKSCAKALRTTPDGLQRRIAKDQLAAIRRKSTVAERRAWLWR
jgi:acyl-CoA reductase-like NAD-dependent aldehyde dehydrogenase